MLSALAALALAACEPPTTSTPYAAKFRSCHDGDTCSFDLTLSDVEARMGFGIVQHTTVVKHNQKVRLCGINAPEIGKDAGAEKSRDDLVKWIEAARDIVLMVPQRKTCEEMDMCDAYEKFGRLLAFVVADGVNLNQKQLDVGNAKPFMECH